MTNFPDTIAALARREEFFVSKRPVFYSRAPGRLDLMGGNDDYTGGLVFQATIREATWAAVQQRNDRHIQFRNPQMAERGWHTEVAFNLDELVTDAAVRAAVQRDAGSRWTAYALGNIYWLKLHHREQISTGVNVYIESDVPLSKGVSSSASLEVAVMKATSAAYGIDLAGVKLAEACQWVEKTWLPNPPAASWTKLRSSWGTKAASCRCSVNPACHDHSCACRKDWRVGS
jgi:galactokinase